MIIPRITSQVASRSQSPPESWRLTSRPIWCDALKPVAAAAPAERRIEADVVVIGGGFAGLSAAYHLLRADPRRQVVLLEGQRIGFGASSRNTGMLTPGVGQNLAGLVRRFGQARARAMYAMSLKAVEYVAELTGREGIDAALEMTGQLIVAHGPSGRRRLARQAAVMDSLRLPCERLDDAALERRLRISTYAPGGPRQGPTALRLAAAGLLHPGRLLAGLAQAVTARGGRILEGACAASISEGRPVIVTLADGRQVLAGHVVVATNGYDAALNIQRGRLLPLHLRLLLTEPLSPDQLAQLNWRGREGVIDSRRVFNYFRLTDDNRILFGGGRPRYRWGGQQADLPANGGDFARLAAEFRRLFTRLADLPFARSWTGVIAYSLDNLPVVGPVSDQGRVIYVGGWCGHGIALSLYSGRWVERFVAGRQPGGAFAWFRRRAPLVPTELARWTGARLGGWAMAFLDRL